MRCCCSCSWCCCFRSNQNTDETLGDASSQNHHRFFFFFFFFPFLKRRRVRRKTRDDGSSRFRSSPSRSFRSSSFQNASSFARIQPTFIIIITSECLLKTNLKFLNSKEMIPRAKKNTLMKKTDEKVKNFFSRIFSSLSIVQSFSLSKSVWRRSRCSLLARFCPSLFTAYFEHRRERAREWVLFLTETRLFTYLLG